MGKTILLIVFMLSSIAFSFAQQADVTQIFITRHAEKADGGKDPELSEAGKERAQRLAKLLQELHIDKLFATPYKRTQQTLAILAEARRLQIEESPADLKAFATTLSALHGETIVIAAHSNTAPQLVNLLLGKEQYGPLSEDEFGKVWLVTLKDGKAFSSLILNTN